MSKPNKLYTDAIKKIILEVTPVIFRNDEVDWDHVGNMILKITETHNETKSKPS